MKSDVARERLKNLLNKDILECLDVLFPNTLMDARTPEMTKVIMCSERAVVNFLHSLFKEQQPNRPVSGEVIPWKGGSHLS
jgi:hypothetical protein